MEEIEVPTQEIIRTNKKRKITSTWSIGKGTMKETKIKERLEKSARLGHLAGATEYTDCISAEG